MKKIALLAIALLVANAASAANLTCKNSAGSFVAPTCGGKNCTVSVTLGSTTKKFVVTRSRLSTGSFEYKTNTAGCTVILTDKNKQLKSCSCATALRAAPCVIK